MSEGHRADENRLAPVELNYPQRLRAERLSEVVEDLPLQAAFEIVYLRDRLTAITKWLEDNHPDAFGRGLWDALS